MRTVAELKTYYAQRSPRVACPSCGLRKAEGTECPRCFTCFWHGLHMAARCPKCETQRRESAEAMGKVKKGATWTFIVIPWFLVAGAISLALYGAFKALEVPGLTWLYDGGAKTEAKILFFGLLVLLLGGAIVVWIINWLTK